MESTASLRSNGNSCECSHLTQPQSSAPDSRHQSEITGGDGGYDIFEHLDLSGEPPIPQLLESFPDGKAIPARSAIEVEKTVLLLKKYRERYQKYWMSTLNDTGTGKRLEKVKGPGFRVILTILERPIDAVILPVVPSAAVIPGKLYHYGISLIETHND
jgi:amidase